MKRLARRVLLAGVALTAMGIEDILAPLPLALGAGLVFGKQIGIFSTIVLADYFGIAKRPDQSFDDLFLERTLLYRKYADITINGDGMNQEDVCRQILANL